MLLQQRNGPATDAAIKPFNLDSSVSALGCLFICGFASVAIVARICTCFLGFGMPDVGVGI